MNTSEAASQVDGSLDSLVASVLDDFRARQKRGENPDVEEYAVRHPEAATLLRNVLATFQFLDGSFPSLAGQDEATPGEASLSGTLGDFRLLREIGRGGMGVVYEAEQISLNRRVALKVLPFAATMDPRHLQRFKNEAQAAASLHHPNIVAVHGVGCERGVHFFAMQLIEGFTLAELIDHLRQISPSPRSTAPVNATTMDVTPHGSTLEARQGDKAKPLVLPEDDLAPFAAGATLTNNALASTLAGQAATGQAYYRTVAQWGIQAAEALEHAHQFGVVHRDIKPGNLMLDQRGNLWITDFGLARGAGDHRLTMTGDVVGTLAYMSPEQALAKHGVVDHRTDVYALGVTLYELLTLRPVVDGKDKQEILKKIALEEPTRPCKLRRDIPADLETIVIKAMAREPEERYASARDLAHDLGSFLEDRAIQARRPPWRTRLARWRRRHKALVRGCAAVLLTALVVIAGSVGWMASDRAARGAATQNAVNSALDESVDWQRQQRLPNALSAARRAVSVVETEDADQALAARAQARLADLQLLESLESASLTVIDALDAKQDDRAYEQVVQRWGLVLRDMTTEEAAAHIRRSSVALEVAAALDHWAVVVRRRARGPDDPQWKGMLQIARAADPDPWRDQVRDALARWDAKALSEIVTPSKVGDLWPGTLTAVADVLVQRGMAELAVTLLREAQRRHPDHFRANEGLGLFLLYTRSPQALHFLTAALVLRPHDPVARNTLGYALMTNKRYDDAIAEFREVIRLKADYAIAHSNLGSALVEKGLLNDAVVEYREAIRLRGDFALFHNNLGNCLHAKGLLDDAIEAFCEAIRLEHGEVVSPEPHFGLGLALEKKGLLDEAIPEFRKAIKLNPDDARFHQHLGICLKKRPEEAALAFGEAVRLDKDAAHHRWNLGLALLRLNRLDEAIAEFRQVIRLDSKHVEAHAKLGQALIETGLPQDAVRVLREVVRLKEHDSIAHYELGRAQGAAGNVAEAIAAYRAALHLYPDFAMARCNLGQALRSAGDYAEALKHLRRGHELGVKEPGWSHPSAQWVKSCEDLVALDAQVADVLSGKAPLPPANAMLKLTQHCLSKGDPASEAALWRRACDAFPGLETKIWKGRLYPTLATLRAAAGKGRNNTLTDLERRTHRARALDLVRAEFAEITKLAERMDVEALTLASRRFADWLRESELAEMWKRENLLALTESEHKAWHALWDDYYRLEKRLASLSWETRFAGTLGTTPAVEHDVKLVAGRTYVIDLESRDFDPMLALHDAAGALLMKNDDREPEKTKEWRLVFNKQDSRLIFQPEQDGRYRLAVSAHKGGRGGYVLCLREFGASEAKAVTPTVP